MDETDEPVVRGSDVDDPERFVDLFWRHGPAVHAYLARRAARQDADDLLSEVWVRAFKGRSGRRNPDVLPWLYGIARNVLRAHWHGTRKAAAPSEPPEAFDPWPDADARLDATRQSESLRRGMATLSKTEREVLLLVVWEHLTPSEAAAVLDIPQGTARSRLHRALSILRADEASSSSALTYIHTKEV